MNGFHEFRLSGRFHGRKCVYEFEKIKKVAKIRFLDVLSSFNRVGRFCLIVNSTGFFEKQDPYLVLCCQDRTVSHECFVFWIIDDSLIS